MGLRTITIRIALYVYHKWHNRRLVRFFISSRLSHSATFEGHNYVGRRASFYGHMGLGASLGDGSALNANIGRFTSIAGGCRQVNARHPYRAPFVTTNSMFYSLKAANRPGYKTYATEQLFDEFVYTHGDIVNEIGNDVWIGADVTLIGGVSIGDGAVVLMNAIVTKDVPPYAIVGGIPAKVVGFRYDEDTIKMLLEKKWWNNTDDWFKENWRLMTDITLLKAFYERNEQL